MPRGACGKRRQPVTNRSWLPCTRLLADIYWSDGRDFASVRQRYSIEVVQLCTW